MLVQQVVDYLQSILISEPDRAGYGVAIGRYEREDGGDVLIQAVRSYSWDEDREFFLNSGAATTVHEFDDRDISAMMLLKELEARPELRGFLVYVRERVTVFPDGGVASFNEPAWGVSVHDGARLIYFEYGKVEPQS